MTSLLSPKEGTCKIRGGKTHKSIWFHDVLSFFSPTQILLNSSQPFPLPSKSFIFNLLIKCSFTFFGTASSSRVGAKPEWHRKWKWSCSVMSDSLRPHGPARLLCPWDSPGKIPEWVVISFSRGSSQPRDWTQVSHTAGRDFNLWATREAKNKFCCIREEGKKDSSLIEYVSLMNWRRLGATTRKKLYLGVLRKKLYLGVLRKFTSGTSL